MPYHFIQTGCLSSNIDPDNAEGMPQKDKRPQVMHVEYLREKDNASDVRRSRHTVKKT